MTHSFRAAVESGDSATLGAVLATDVLFRSPAVFSPYVGRDAAMHVLGTVFLVFEDFRYVAELTEGDEQVLRFTATVGGKNVDGIDLVRYDAAGQVAELTVMIRPLSALLAVAEAMGKQLAAEPN